MRKTRASVGTVVLVNTLCAVVACRGPAAAPAPSAAVPVGTPAMDDRAAADFYRGKTVRLVVAYAAGGGYDTYARAISKHLDKHLDGRPTVIVENMQGAGGLSATNQVYNVLTKDG